MMAPRTLERLVDDGASASLGGATAFAAFQGLAAVAGQILAAVVAIAAAAFAHWLSRRFLGAVQPAARDPGATECADDPTMAELLLDVEVVADPNARVVRLFDPAALPAPRQSLPPSGQLANSVSAAPPDASQDLREALNQLRRSLHKT